MPQRFARALTLMALALLPFLPLSSAQAATTTRLDVPQTLTYIFFGRAKLSEGRMVAFSAYRFHAPKPKPGEPAPPAGTPDYLSLGSLSVADKDGNSLFEASSLDHVSWSGRWKTSGRSQWFAGTATFIFVKSSQVKDGVSFTYATVKYTQNVGGPPVCTIDIAKYPLHVRIPYSAQSGLSAALITSW